MSNFDTFEYPKPVERLIERCDWCGKPANDCTEHSGHNVCQDCQDQHRQATQLVEKAGKQTLLDRMEAAK